MFRRARALLVLMILCALALTGCKSSSSNSIGSGGNGTTATAPANAQAGGAATQPSAAASGDTSGTAANTAADCPTSNTIGLAKTKFVLHVGLAAGTFHRYIYKPLRAGGFSKGAKGRVGAFIKAGATALFDKREIRLAAADVKANPTLCKLIAAPLAHLSDTLSSIGSKIRGGDTSAVEDANTQISNISSMSSAQGAPITESTDESAG